MPLSLQSLTISHEHQHGLYIPYNLLFRRTNKSGLQNNIFNFSIFIQQRFRDRRIPSPAAPKIQGPLNQIKKQKYGSTSSS